MLSTTSRRRVLQCSAAASAVAFSAPALTRTRATTHQLAAGPISETFVFPEWTRAMRLAVAGSGTRADAAFWALWQSRMAEGRARTGLLTLPAPGLELFDPALAHALSVMANDRLAAAVRASNGRLAGLAAISAADPHAAREAARVLTQLGLAGLSIGANRGWRLDHPQLHDVFAIAVANGAPVYLPAAYAPLAGDAPYRARGDAGIIAGAAAESANHARQLIFGGVLDAHPGLRVVLGRLGEATPYWHGHLRDTYDALAHAGRKLPQRPVEAYFADQIQLTTADMTSPTAASFCNAVLGQRRVLAADDQRRRWTI